MGIFKIYGGTALVSAERRKSRVKSVVNRKGYFRSYPKRLSSGEIVRVKRYVKPYRRSLAGTIKRLRIVQRVRRNG